MGATRPPPPPVGNPLAGSAGFAGSSPSRPAKTGSGGPPPVWQDKLKEPRCRSAVPQKNFETLPRVPHCEHPGVERLDQEMVDGPRRAIPPTQHPSRTIRESAIEPASPTPRSEGYEHMFVRRYVLRLAPKIYSYPTQRVDMAKKTSRDACWETAIREVYVKGKPVNADFVAEVAGVSRRTAVDVLNTMVDAYFLEQERVNDNGKIRYIADDGFVGDVANTHLR